MNASINISVKHLLVGAGTILLSFLSWSALAITENAEVNAVQDEKLHEFRIGMSEFKSEIRFLSDTIQELAVTLERNGGSR